MQLSGTECTKARSVGSPKFYKMAISRDAFVVKERFDKVPQSGEFDFTTIMQQKLIFLHIALLSLKNP